MDFEHDAHGSGASASDDLWSSGDEVQRSFGDEVPSRDSGAEGVTGLGRHFGAEHSAAEPASRFSMITSGQESAPFSNFQPAQYPEPVPKSPGFRLPEQNLDLPISRAPERQPGQFIALKKTPPTDVMRDTLADAPAIRAGLIECPKCLTLNRVSEIECRKCGVVFDRFREGDAETQAELLALAKTPALIKQWNSLLDDYMDWGAHHAFVADCEKLGTLAFASRKYSEILEVAPNEEIARSMQNQIVGLAGNRFALPVRTIPLTLRIPMLNALVTLFSATALIMGIYIPHMRSMAWVGGILLFLSVLVRFLTLAR